jgi:hypothetical protein
MEGDTLVYCCGGYNESDHCMHKDQLKAVTVPRLYHILVERDFPSSSFEMILNVVRSGCMIHPETLCHKTYLIVSVVGVQDFSWKLSEPLP